jgi:hypothetical protein
VQSVGIIKIIQFILDSLFDSNILPLNETEIGLIKSLVDSSLQLLNTNIDFVIEEEGTICRYFQECNFDILNDYFKCC